MKITPNKFISDSYGRQLFVGQVVAFNKSGGVRRGVIESIKAVKVRGEICDQWTGKLYAHVKVRDADGDVSTIKNLDGIMTI